MFETCWYKKYKRISDTWINWDNASRTLGLSQPWWDSNTDGPDIDRFNKSAREWGSCEISSIVGYCDHGRMVEIRPDSIVILFELTNGDTFWAHYLKE